MERKLCKRCGEFKSLSDFHRDRGSADGRCFYCAECNKAKMKATRNANIDEYRRRAREARPVGTQRETGLYRKYHLTIEGWDELLARQGGGCAVCGAKPAQEPHNRNPTATRASLHVDHDHACCPGPYSCGRCVRGLLCSRCNRAVGLMADNPERLRAAADYVERSRSDAVPI